MPTENGGLALPERSGRYLFRSSGLLTALQRLLTALVTLLAVIFIAYAALYAASGVPWLEAVLTALRRTNTYLGRLAAGDLGATATGTFGSAAQPVVDVLPGLAGKSLGLLAAAIAFATVLGVPLGLAAALRRHSPLSRLTVLLSIVGVSLPSFLLAFLLQLAVIQLTRILGFRLLPVGGFGWDGHLMLPALVLAARPLAQITRVSFISLGQVLERDFIRTARGKGLPSAAILVRHLLRNSAVPILTTVGVSVRFALSSLPVVEYFFGWPGLGAGLLRALSRGDDSLTVSLVLTLGLVFVLTNLILESSYRIIDPQLRRPVGRVSTDVAVSLRDALASLPADARDWLRGLGHLLPRRGGDARVSSPPAGAVPHEEKRRRARLRLALSNVEFVSGTVLVLGLIILVLFGPRLAPHSPYTTQGISFKDGVLSVPPFAPGGDHPWGTDKLGRDLLSLVMAGAQQTLVVVAAVVAARLAVGMILGLLSGWHQGGRLDRFLSGLAETVAAFPALLLAMAVILALGIRRGLPPFIVGLALVGWGEVMQFVRAETITLRPRPFIEAAVATGVRPLRLIVTHVIPNLVPGLISLAALEMGSVLMLLGELGFIGIFIGGGFSAEVAAEQMWTYSDVPEWGALLSNLRETARAYPWTGIYPGLAFFAAILGFNLFGEGLRRLVDQIGIHVSRLVNRYTALVLVAALVGGRWAQDNLGAIAVYRQQAARFDGAAALAQAEALTAPEMQGRALGSPGAEGAARYIADRFQDLGLQAAGEKLTYFQNQTRSFLQLDTAPALSLDDSGPAPVYRQDYAEYAASYLTTGRARGSVRFLAFGDLTEATSSYSRQDLYFALRYSDYSDEVVVVLSEEDAQRLARVPVGAILIVTADEDTLLQRHTLSPRSPMTIGAITTANGRPMLSITQELADRLLAGAGETVNGLRARAERLGLDEVLDVSTGVTAAVDVPGTVQERVPAVNVIGHLPGVAQEYDDRLIIVLAQYDGPPLGPEGAYYDGAGTNAAGVATMLEIIRTFRDSGYQPYKTFLFVAYSGEGYGSVGAVYPPEIKDFLAAKQGFSGAFQIEGVVDLRGLGAGDGNGLVITTGGNRRLAEEFETAARQAGVPATRAPEQAELLLSFDDTTTAAGRGPSPLTIGWDGAEALAAMPGDTAAALSEEKLEDAGRAVTLALMKMGRDTSQ